jgi:hypothetical protein
MADCLMFERWEDVPQGMVLKQVLAAQGLRPPKGASPVGWVVTPRRRYALWAVEGAVEVKRRGGAGEQGGRGAGGIG